MASYNGSKVAGRTVYRRRMGQTRYPELDRSTQLPQNVKSKKLEHRVGNQEIGRLVTRDGLTLNRFHSV
jgi:predicted transcriptional regulator